MGPVAGKMGLDLPFGGAQLLNIHVDDRPYFAGSFSISSALAPSLASISPTIIEDMAGRLANRIQLTTDGHKPYLTAVDKAFGEEIDYAQLVKIHGADVEGQKRYSPARCIGTRTQTVVGVPDPAHTSTSYVERSNLSIRMGTRRFTRLTNAFSKKVENHAAAVVLFLMSYSY